MIKIISSNQRGFTFLEVMIALTLLSIGTLAVSAMCVSSTQASAKSKRITAAAILAQDKLEEFKNQTFSAIPIGTNTADPNNPVDEQGNAGGCYNRSWTVTTVAPFTFVKRVVCTVSWDSGNHSVSLYTMITR